MEEEKEELTPFFDEDGGFDDFSSDFQADVATAQALVEPIATRDGTCRRLKKYRDPETAQDHEWQPGTAYHTMMVHVQYSRLVRKKRERGST